MILFDMNRCITLPCFDIIHSLVFQAIDTFTDITVGANSNGNDDLSICIMLFDNDSRNGGWIDFLTENRFLPRVGPTSLNGETVLKEFNTYCKTFPDDKYDPDITYTFPSPNGERFTHGLCVMGATTAFAYSSDPDLHYSMIPDFKDGVRGWSDRTYKYTGVNGPEMCEGGMYLRPSVVKVCYYYAIKFLFQSPSKPNVSIYFS